MILNHKVFELCTVDKRSLDLHKLKTIHVLVNGKHNGAILKDIFKDYELEDHKIVGYSVLEYYKVKDSYLIDEGGNKISFFDPANNVELLIVKVRNPWIILEEKEVKDTYVKDVSKLLHLKNVEKMVPLSDEEKDIIEKEKVEARRLAKEAEEKEKAAELEKKRKEAEEKEAEEKRLAEEKEKETEAAEAKRKEEEAEEKRLAEEKEKEVEAEKKRLAEEKEKEVAAEAKLKEEKFNALIAEAAEKEKSGKLDKAVILLQKALELNEDSAVKEKIDSLNKQIEEITAKDNQVLTFIQSGDDFFKEGQYVKAIESYRDALKLDGDNKLTKEKIEKANAKIEAEKNKLGGEEYEELKEFYVDQQDYKEYVSGSFRFLYKEGDDPYVIQLKPGAATELDTTSVEDEDSTVKVEFKTEEGEERVLTLNKESGKVKLSKAVEKE